MRLFKYTLFFTKMQYLSKERRYSVNYFYDLETRPKNLWKRTWCRHSWCALPYPFLAMICNHMRGTSVIPSSWHAWYTVVPRAAAPSASGAPGKAPSMKIQ